VQDELGGDVQDELGGARAQSGPRGPRLLHAVEAQDAEGDSSRAPILGTVRSPMAQWRPGGGRTSLLGLDGRSCCSWSSPRFSVGRDRGRRCKQRGDAGDVREMNSTSLRVVSFRLIIFIPNLCMSQQLEVLQ
jgi:hypothetical protein